MVNSFTCPPTNGPLCVVSVPPAPVLSRPFFCGRFHFSQWLLQDLLWRSIYLSVYLPIHPPSIHPFLRPFKFNSLSKFWLYNIVLSTQDTLLSLRVKANDERPAVYKSLFHKLKPTIFSFNTYIRFFESKFLPKLRKAELVK